MADESKLQVDDSWKSQAEKEKQDLSGANVPAAAEGAEPDAVAPRNDELPPASFQVLVQQYATQVFFALGLIPHPGSGKTQKDLKLAKHYIDLLGIVAEKTKGNLTDTEQRLLDGALYEARMHYVAAVRGR